MTQTAWSPLARQMVARLVERGELPEAWHDVFAAVPRHVFVPDHPIVDAYSDQPLVTQTRPAPVPGGPGVDLPTSSLSAPGAVAVMLARLDAHPGHRVLEIGTGSGYNAAVLSRRLGESNVYSVDLDPELVERARHALANAGYHPTLAARDGYTGLPDAAPFDRIIATCAVTHIPPAWINQLTPGGRLVTPLLGGDDAALAVLTKTAEDELTGRIDTAQVAFMPLRPRIDDPLADGHTLTYTTSRMPHYGTTRLDPNNLVDADPDLLLFTHLHLPGMTIGTSTTLNTTPNETMTTVTTPYARAVVNSHPDDHGLWALTQYGHRIWDTIEHAVQLWTELGHPDRTRLGITAINDQDRQYVWLDDPDGPYSWPMPL